MKRLEGKIAIVVGAGQTPGVTVGNGRATALRFAREGAIVVAVDKHLDWAQETVDQIRSDGCTATAWAADVTDENSLQAMVAEVMRIHARIDILHNNVGISGAGGDGPLETLSQDAFDLIFAVNLRGMAMTCKQVLPIMKQQKQGVVVNVGSVAALSINNNVAYKTTKAGVIALTQNVALQYAALGIRANCILPGLIETPMAVETRVKMTEASREEILAGRHARVPLRGRMGTAWDIANAAVFLASDEAHFITGISLPVDGGALAHVGT